MLSKGVWKELQKFDNTLKLEADGNIKLNSVGNGKTSILGIAYLKPSILNIEVNVAVPFAIIE